MAKLIIACWTYPTKSRQSCGKGLSERLRALKNRVAQCALEVTKLGKDGGEDQAFNAIFAAPEYLFSAAAEEREPLSSDERDLLYQKLLKISRNYKNILIAPGTIFFQEETKTLEDHQRHLSNVVMAEIAARRWL